LLSKSEAARRLRVSTKTVERLVRRGHLVATKVGGQVRIERADLLALVNARRTASLDPLTDLDRAFDNSIAAAKRAAAKGEFIATR